MKTLLTVPLLAVLCLVPAVRTSWCATDISEPFPDVVFSSNCSLERGLDNATYVQINVDNNSERPIYLAYVTRKVMWVSSRQLIALQGVPRTIIDLPYQAFDLPPMQIQEIAASQSMEYNIPIPSEVLRFPQRFKDAARKIRISPTSLDDHVWVRLQVSNVFPGLDTTKASAMIHFVENCRTVELGRPRGPKHPQRQKKRQ